jgi:hypothetical protein
MRRTDPFLLAAAAGILHVPMHTRRRPNPPAPTRQRKRPRKRGDGGKQRKLRKGGRR